MAWVAAGYPFGATALDEEQREAQKRRQERASKVNRLKEAMVRSRREMSMDRYIGMSENGLCGHYADAVLDIVDEMVEERLKELQPT